MPIRLVAFVASMLYSVAVMFRRVKHALQNTQLRGFLTALECTKFVFGRSSARTQLEELTASPNRLAGLWGPTSKGKEKMGMKGLRREGEGEKGRGREMPYF